MFVFELKTGGILCVILVSGEPIYVNIGAVGKKSNKSSIPDEVNFLIYLTLPAALGPGVYSASNRNEYQKHKNYQVTGE
jgi:hypothetical protein